MKRGAEAIVDDGAERSEKMDSKARKLLYKPKREPPKDGDFKIKWEMTSSLKYNVYDPEEDVYVHEYKGILWFKKLNLDDHTESSIEIGHVLCTKIKKTHILNDGFSLFETLDERSDELMRVAKLLDALDGSKGKECAVNEVGDGCEITQGDVLYINNLFVKKDYRGMGLGLFLLNHADRVLNSHMSLCVLIPFPSQYDYNPDEEQINPAWADFEDIHSEWSILPPELERQKEEYYHGMEVAKDKLRTLYRKLGFGVLKVDEEDDDEFMGRWNGYQTPTIQTLLPALFK